MGAVGWCNPLSLLTATMTIQLKGRQYPPLSDHHLPAHPTTPYYDLTANEPFVKKTGTDTVLQEHFSTDGSLGKESINLVYFSFHSTVCYHFITSR